MASSKPHLTLQELASYAGVDTKERARQLLDTGIRTLYEADPQELQQRYDLDSLLSSRQKGKPVGVPLSSEAKEKIAAALRGKKHSPESRARMSEAQTGRFRSPEARAKISESKRGKPRKPCTPESRARMSEARRKYWERRKQQTQNLDLNSVQTSS
jgi:hypothetical protein